MEELVAFASVLGGGDAVLGDARTVSMLESAGGASRERMTVVLRSAVLSQSTDSCVLRPAAN